MAESNFVSLETELIDRGCWRTHLEARMAVFDYIEGLYNPPTGASGPNVEGQSAAG
jgi:putative transposase